MPNFTPPNFGDSWDMGILLKEITFLIPLFRIRIFRNPLSLVCVIKDNYANFTFLGTMVSR